MAAKKRITRQRRGAPARKGSKQAIGRRGSARTASASRSGGRKASSRAGTSTRTRKAPAKKDLASAPPRRAKAASKKAKPKAATAPQKSGAAVVESGKVPNFSASDQRGTVFSSAALSGQPYVIYFYPKDDTPGCTKEACGFRDRLPDFLSRRVRVLGVSPDSTQSHTRFQQKYELTFPLLSDPDKKMAQAFGVWVKKQNYGREYMGIERSTFLVDGEGKIRKIWRGVRVDGHVEAVLGAVRELE
ncbi:MAG TPA: redoxin domain-containing protein [Polyangiaceae bacterium]|jgi:peroxiredoxin Q/BCP